MERVGFLCILLGGGFLLVSSAEIPHVAVKKGNIATLKCGQLTKGNVTWSRDTNGEKVDILTNNYGNMTKLIADPGRRYSLGHNLELTIFRVSQSDAGRYYCNGATAELTITGTGVPSTEEPRTEHLPGRPGILKLVVAMVAGSFLVAIVSVSLLCLYFCRIKAEDKIEQLYAKVQKPKK